jgi:hypothetical protein
VFQVVGKRSRAEFLEPYSYASRPDLSQGQIHHLRRIQVEAKLVFVSSWKRREGWAKKGLRKRSSDLLDDAICAEVFQSGSDKFKFGRFAGP